MSSAHVHAVFAGMPALWSAPATNTTAAVAKIRPVFQAVPCTPIHAACRRESSEVTYTPSTQMSCVADANAITQRIAMMTAEVILRSEGERHRREQRRDQELRREHEELLRLRHVEKRRPERLQRPRDADRPGGERDLGIGVAEILEHRAGDPDHDRERHAFREVRRGHPPARRRDVSWIAVFGIGLCSTCAASRSSSRPVPDAPAESASRSDEHEAVPSSIGGSRACWVAHSSGSLALLCSAWPCCPRLAGAVAVERSRSGRRIVDGHPAVEQQPAPTDTESGSGTAGSGSRLRHRPASAWVGRSSTSGTRATRPRSGS